MTRGRGDPPGPPLPAVGGPLAGSQEPPADAGLKSSSTGDPQPAPAEPLREDAEGAAEAQQGLQPALLIQGALIGCLEGSILARQAAPAEVLRGDHLEAARGSGGEELARARHVAAGGDHQQPGVAPRATRAAASSASSRVLWVTSLSSRSRGNPELAQVASQESGARVRLASESGLQRGRAARRVGAAPPQRQRGPRSRRARSGSRAPCPNQDGVSSHRSVSVTSVTSASSCPH